MRRLLALALLLLVPVGLAACSGERTVDVEKAEKQIGDGYAKQVKGALVQEVACPEDIAAENGTKAKCEMTLARDVRLDVALEVVSEEDDGRIRWTVVAGTLPGTLVEEKASDALEQQAGGAPDLISCPERVDIEVGSTTRCEVTVDAQTYGATVTITDETGGFDIKVDGRPTT